MTRCFTLLFLALLCGCAKPVANMAYVAPDLSHWVAIEQQPPDAEKDELLPTVRLRLMDRFHGRVIYTGAESMCATSVIWQDNSNLLLRVPADRAEYIKVPDGEYWGGVNVHVALHEDQLKLEKWSADGLWRLVVVESCETENWNLYLRRAGDPTFNQAMKTGWDDPDLAGGFEATQPPISLKWTGPRSAEIQVPGKSYGVTTRDKVGEVSIHWKFLPHAKVPESKFETIQPLKR